MFKRLKNAWLVLTNSDANALVGLAGHFLIAAARGQNIAGNIIVERADKTKEIFEYSLKVKEG